MKKQIPTLIIGILIGAILSTSVLLIVKNNTTPSIPSENGFDMSKFNPGDGDFNPEDGDFDPSKMTRPTDQSSGERPQRPGSRSSSSNTENNA